MTRLAVCSMAHGVTWKTLSEVTFKSIGEYAQRIGAAFVPLEERCGGRHNHWEKLDMGKLLWDYDRVAWIDGDCIVNPKAESLFEVVPADHFGALDEGSLGMDRSKEYEWAAQVHKLPVLPPVTQYLNSGVMVFGREHVSAFLPPQDRQQSPLGACEQTWLSCMILTMGFRFTALPREYNAFYGIFTPPERRQKAQIMHYACHPKGPGQYEKLVESMQEVQSAWKEPTGGP